MRIFPVFYFFHRNFQLPFSNLTIQTPYPLLDLVADESIDSSEKPESDRLLTAVGYDSPHGYKRVEVRHGDITKMTVEHDLLVISAFSEGYQPTPGSLMGALLKNLGLSVKELSENMFLDLRKPLSTWISQPLEKFSFKRILCVEMVGTDFSMEEVFENLFASVGLLHSKQIETQSILMPLLGGGEQGISRAGIIRTLLPRCQEALSTSQKLQRITFAERDPEKALEIDRAISEVLGRKELKFPRNEVMESLRNEILTLASQAAQSHPETELFSEITNVFRRQDLRSFEAGVLARRLVEFVVDDVIRKDGSTPGIDLYNKIETLHNRKVSMWMSSYMHLLRIFGNESVHERYDDRLPSELTENDFIISLFCLNRVLRFWLDTE